MEELIRKLLVELGEDPKREGLQRTPERVQESLEFLTSGYREDPEEIFRGAVFEEKLAGVWPPGGRIWARSLACRVFCSGPACACPTWPP